MSGGLLTRLMVSFAVMRFWTTYPGMVALGFLFAVPPATLATLMVMFRPFFEPIASWVYPIVVDFAGRQYYYFKYSPDDYIWIVGLLYALSGVFAGTVCYAIYNKPASDRRLDAYLSRHRHLDQSHVSSREP